mmetsp:Transcript_71361/g.201261  ORF Transcript_71361/g.201261 Transcript_71361/m.201261 type:complete len:284 (+) Transcript_71361:253-1104(+)|eukprot:CAMPEP_0119474894 /NCGR_PEP_ID=MMETSP1344-20130328/5969_1 /TAXON_ID=236787 /ORGANISM="Florenciella parvula, Strain CCMP2471" /LENGTH=283 /DNA_ID=CAMNT_0007508277 /DNA_START=219 /DNA_END=1070 /DNA_ORIENTATION=-
MAANGSSAGPTDGAAAAAAAEEFDLDFDDIPATPPPPPVIEEGEEWLTPGESTDFQNDPSGLVGKCVEVEGLGVGTVEGFNKAHNKLLYDSKHVVEFSSGPQTILLRRRKMGKWNGGLNFKIISRETALEAELGDDFSIEDFDMVGNDAQKGEAFDDGEEQEEAPRQTDLQVLRRNSDMCPMPPPATGASRDALFFRRTSILKSRRSSSVCSSISEGSTTGTLEAEPATFVPPPPPRPPPPPAPGGRRASLPPVALQDTHSAFQTRMARMAEGQQMRRGTTMA